MQLLHRILPKIKYIIAPHEISNNPKRIKKYLGNESILYSNIKLKTNLKELSCLIIEDQQLKFIET